MNLSFKKINLAEAVNDEDASVRSIDRELMEYRRNDYRAVIEVFFRGGVAVAYAPQLPTPYPIGMTAEAVLEEIRKGVEVNAECAVEWRAAGR
ncbi:hypothetical protein [Sphingomonas montana]|uniref:hypothetical protein n=1 Tax=Sphingomonas montana TaxID=1843236 RepID=UPI00096C5750|nr:hypothetical protein [Sphingomonas montana]